MEAIICVETPKKYIYEENQAKTSQAHHEAHSSFQGIIDKLLIFKKENENLTLNELAVFAKGILNGRNKKNDYAKSILKRG